MLKRLTALAVVAFLVTLAASSPTKATESVTFQVHMGAMMQAGTFNASTDTVVIRGDFQVMAGDTGHYGSSGNQNWGGIAFRMAKSTTNDSIFTLTVVFPDTASGKTINYKFVMINSANSYRDSVTNGGMWENIPGNRTDSITTDASQQIPLAYFGNQKPGVTAKVSITFQVNMSKLIGEGFDDANDSVFVNGEAPLPGWGTGGARLYQSLENPSVYEVQLSLSYIVGSNVRYKAYCAGKDQFSNGGYESSPPGSKVDGYLFSFPNKDTTILWTPYLHVTSPSTVADTVTFHVDMNNAYDGIHYKAIKNLKGVWISGSVRPLNWAGAGWPLSDTVDESSAIDTTAMLHRMYDDGTHGDSVAADGKWSLKLVFRAGVSSYVEYKFGAKFDGYDTLTIGGVVSNGSLIDNESNIGVNHSVVLSGSSQSVYNHFGDMDPANPGTGIKQIPNGVPAKFDLTQNYPNPFNPTTQINYSIPKNAFVTLKIYNVLGQEVATLYSGLQKAGNYAATFNAGRFASGVYFYRLSAGSFSSVKKMMLLK